MDYLNENIVKYPQPTEKPLVLGSSSSNRKTILRITGWDFTVMIPDIDEKAIRHDDPNILPVLIAKAKARAVIDRQKEVILDGIIQPFILLTSDQIVLFGSEVREKPVDEAEAIRFLSSYSNTEVSTISAVVATHYPSGYQSSEMVKATVHFGEISQEIVKNVVGRGEIYSSAGGFRIEDEDLNSIILQIEGTVDSVLGMPLEATVRVIQEVERIVSETADSSGL